MQQLNTFTNVIHAEKNIHITMNYHNHSYQPYISYSINQTLCNLSNNVVQSIIPDSLFVVQTIKPKVVRFTYQISFLVKKTDFQHI